MHKQKYYFNPGVYIHNYYDGYGFINGTGFTDSNYKLTEAQKAYGKGCQTGSVISIFGDSKKIYLMYQYDIQGRVVKTVQNNLLDGLDVTETTYTFSSNPQTVVHKNTYKENGTQKSITETYTYTYDYADRISKVEHTLNNTKVVLSENTYNKLGQLVNRSLHGASADIMGYAYNIRSWLTRIESPNLILKLNYGYSAGGGNIASMFWKSGEEGRQKYTFTYDGLGRMLNADHLILGQQDEDDDDWGVTTGLMSIQTGRQIEETPLARENAFTERVKKYDKNGNILELVRYGQTGANSYGVIDNLTMTLTGNQLNRVDDASTASAYGGGFEFKDAVKQDNEYAYDANGNLTQDLNKGIEDIQYNCLNLPRLVKFKDQSTITYTYAADGTKLRVEHKIGNSTTRTTYCSNVIYEDGTAKCLLTEEGYVSLDDREYHYYLKDHQGNNRVLVNKNGGVEEINHYYPFGGVFASEENVQPYKYNGKELDTKKGLNWYDYGARMYDAAVGRFTTTDRFAEKYYSMSSYQYGGNNPVGNIDINGDSIVILSLTNSQHLGMLIQNESKKWQYYSFNGDKVYNSTNGVIGGRPHDDIAIGEWNSPQEFINSDYNQGIKVKEDKANPEINAYGYQEGYVLPTTTEQDRIIEDKFIDSINQGYSLIGNHCSIAVQKSLNAVGIETRNPSIEIKNRQMGDVYSVRINPYLPSNAYQAIKKNNPQGYVIKKR